MAAVGFIEGPAEAATSSVKIVSGVASDWIGRRKPLVVFGYALSALVKTVFPISGAMSTVLLASMIDLRLGHKPININCLGALKCDRFKFAVFSLEDG